MKFKLLTSRAVIVVVAALAASGLVFGQVTAGTISGFVKDPAGKVVPNAQITAVDGRRAITRTTRTDASGRYELIGLAPSDYTVTAAAQGFAPSTHVSVSLRVDTAIEADISLVVAGVNTQVTVSSSPSRLQTETADVGDVIDQHVIQTMPLNARQFLQLALLSPGVFPPVEGSQLSSNGSTSMEVNGGREEHNDFLLDGVDNNDPYVSGYVVEPPIDSVQEFKLVTSSYGAQYGRSAAGQINVITRGGSNDLHASAYEYLRNKVLDARNYFDGAGFVKPPYLRSQFGGTVGGPIRKDRTFVFGNTEFFRQRQAISQQSLVPTDAERSGDLSGLGVTIVDPFSGVPFPNNTIPPASISPIALDILKMFPEPNLTGAVNNYLGQPVEPENHMQNAIRGDHWFSPADNLTLRYAMGSVNVFQPYPVGVTAAAPGFGDSIDDHTHNAMIREQHDFGARANNSLLLGFNRFSRDFLPQNYRTDVGTLWGVDWLNLPARDYGYPTINVSGFAQVGDNSSFPNLRHTNMYELSDNFLFIHGRHTFAFGVDARKMQLNGRLDELVRGSMSFYGAITGSSISDLLLGYPSFGIQAQANNPIRLRTTSYDGYFQDDWNILPSLVLNLGGRYEFNRPATDPSNAMSEMNLETGQLVQVGTNGVSASGISPDYKNFAPRLGVAWHAAQGLELRAGYGVFYDSGMFVVGSAAYFNPPQFVLNVFFPSSTSLLSLQSPFPLGEAYAPPAALSVLDPNMITPYLQQWNISAEEDLGRRGTLSVSYVGSAGSHLISERDLNQPLLSPTGSQDNLQSRRPYPQYGSIFYIGSDCSSTFKALEVRFTGHPVRAVSLWGSYTYSQSFDGASAFLASTADPNFPQNSHDVAAERGPSSFDMRNRFVGAYVVTLPQRNRWTKDIEFQGIFAAQSGQPFTPMVSFDNSNTGNTGQQSGSDRPNVLGNAHLKNPTPNEWFNKAAFSIAPPNTYGNAGRNSLVGPAYSSFDVSILRRFPLGERITLTMEAQSFNLFNRPNFALPAAYADQPNFGVISTAGDPRQLQFAARLSF